MRVYESYGTGHPVYAIKGNQIYHGYGIGHPVYTTLTSYDIIMYERGFCGNGILFIPLPHHAGTSDCLEIKIDEFDEWFDKTCEGYKRTRTGKRL